MVPQQREKTRNQSQYEYFETLQLEWIQADLRFKIYPSMKDKKYWTKVKDGKGETIHRLAERYHLPTIFTDNDMLRNFEKKVYREESYPLFTYKDEQQKADQEYFDLLYYYSVGETVRCEFFGEIRIGTIKKYEPFDELIEVEFDDKVVEKISVAKVTRIL